MNKDKKRANIAMAKTGRPVPFVPVVEAPLLCACMHSFPPSIPCIHPFPLNQFHSFTQIMDKRRKVRRKGMGKAKKGNGGEGAKRFDEAN